MILQVKLLRSLIRDIRQVFRCTISSVDEKEFLARCASQRYRESTICALDDLLLDGLATGKLKSSSDFPGAAGPVPDLFRDLWLGIFAADGTLLTNPDKHCIIAIRQLSRTFKKVFDVCADDKVQDAIEAFEDTDLGLPVSMSIANLSSVNAALHGQWLFNLPSNDELVFKHGPGAVAERLDSVGRWDFPSFSPYHVAEFDMSDFSPHYEEEWPAPVMEQVGRLVAVPKTFDKPRLISIEPASAMYTQQGLLRALDHRMSRIKQLNMRDQSRNRELARLASIDGRLSTIDLSEASDRVSLALVSEVFRLNPGFLGRIMGLRTPAVDTGHGVVQLKKYASMGCALTFPVQMLVFRTICITAMCEQDDDLSLSNIRRWGSSPDVGFFGDDIIVPTSHVQSVIAKLEACELRVNGSKSFTTGLFRESCGGDYYAGTDVKPTYVRKNPSFDRHDVDTISSLAATSHLFEERGFTEAAKLLSKHVEGLIGPSPLGDGAISVSHPSEARTRYNKRLQRHEVHANIAVQRRKRVRGSDHATLCAALAALSRDSWEFHSPVAGEDPLRLTHHGRPTSAFISRRWVGQH